MRSSGEEFESVGVALCWFGLLEANFSLLSANFECEEAVEEGFQ